MTTGDLPDLRGCPECGKSVRTGQLNCPRCDTVLEADPAAGDDSLEEEVFQGIEIGIVEGSDGTISVSFPKYEPRAHVRPIPRHRRKARLKLLSLPRKILAAALAQPTEAIQCARLPDGSWQVTAGGQAFVGQDELRKAIADLGQLRCLRRGDGRYFLTRRGTTIGARLHLRKG